MAQTMQTPPSSERIEDVPAYCRDLADRARLAGDELASTAGSRRGKVLHAIADRIAESQASLREANRKDLERAREAGLDEAMLDRLELTERRLEAMAESVRRIAAQPDPVGRVIEGRVLPNGIRLEKRRVPIGVVLIVFESRPNVTCDAAALCLASGNAVILRGGREAIHSNQAIARCVREGLEQAGGDPDAVQLVTTPDRAVVNELLKMEGRIDLCIPRGGESLIRAVAEQARLPVIKHYAGNCHVYVDEAADDDMAERIVLNAKCQRTGVCNAAETLLIHEAAARRGLLERLGRRLAEAGVEIRADEHARRTLPDAGAASEQDWRTEYLEPVLAVRVVRSLEEAIGHISRYGSRHTDAIVTSRIDAADAFTQRVDAANVFVNCSTRFSDGGQYGLGAEIGISTDKLHARGPMGADDLTTYKWIARGNGQIRE